MACTAALSINRNLARTHRYYLPPIAGGQSQIKLQGHNPDRIILVTTSDTLSVLRAAADILGCSGIGAVVIEPWGDARALDLTASRRLVLAAETSGITAFILAGQGGLFCQRCSHALVCRISIVRGSARQCAGACCAVGRTCPPSWWRSPFGLVMEWDREEHVFREPTLSRAVLPPAQRRPLAA